VPRGYNHLSPLTTNVCQADDSSHSRPFFLKATEGTGPVYEYEFE
jgi:hypothetical protein